MTVRLLLQSSILAENDFLSPGLLQKAVPGAILGFPFYLVTDLGICGEVYEKIMGFNGNGDCHDIMGDILFSPEYRNALC